MRAHFLQKNFLFLLVHNSEFLETLSRIIVSDHILIWSSAQWVKQLPVLMSRYNNRRKNNNKQSEIPSILYKHVTMLFNIPAKLLLLKRNYQKVTG